MASCTCHVFAGTKRVRLERIVRAQLVLLLVRAQERWPPVAVLFCQGTTQLWPLLRFALGRARAQKPEGGRLRSKGREVLPEARSWPWLFGP